MNYYKIFLREQPDIIPQLIPAVIEGPGIVYDNLDTFKIQVAEDQSIFIPFTNVLLACEIKEKFLTSENRHIRHEEEEMKKMINQMFPVDICGNTNP